MNDRRIRYDEALRLVLEGTASETGVSFHRALARNLARALDAKGAWVTEYLPEQNRLRALAFWLGDDFVESYEYDVRHTPCEDVIAERVLSHVPEDVVEMFPDDPDLEGLGAVSYIGAPLLDGDRVMGNLAVFDDRPMPFEEGLRPVFELFAARAQAERLRMAAEERTRRREQQLALLLATAMDAIVLLDERLFIVEANPAAERLFGTENLRGVDLRRLAGREDRHKLEALVAALDRELVEDGQLWIPGSLHLATLAGTSFPAEATLSRHECEEGRRWTLIVRSVQDRVEAEQRIAHLTHRANWLTEAVEEQSASEIVGQSPSIRAVLENVARVAETDATVLVQGETGTGKELVARAIHAGSRRKAEPFVAVNCGALPTSLIESELFGHEQGAFTGATERRSGRFARAHGGTLFLDEIAELPLDVQAKLLRVVQEGEYEPLGAQRTEHVDVRIVAATHRDLEELTRLGEFREDLYYRLSVFPIRLPALRERGDDVVLLANAFIARLARRLGRPAGALTEHDVRLLREHAWPGNVRELQNVIERALILSRGQSFSLARAMPRAVEESLVGRGAAEELPLLTDADVRALERRNIQRTLAAAGGKIAGKDGAAERLGLKPSTLASRMKSLGVERPV